MLRRARNGLQMARRRRCSTRTNVMGGRIQGFYWKVIGLVGDSYAPRAPWSEIATIRRNGALSCGFHVLAEPAGMALSTAQELKYDGCGAEPMPRIG